MVCGGFSDFYLDSQCFHTFPVGMQVERGTRMFGHYKTNDDDIVVRPARRAPPVTPASTRSMIGNEDQDLASLEDFLNPLLDRDMNLANDRQLLLQAAYADGLET